MRFIFSIFILILALSGVSGNNLPKTFDQNSRYCLNCHAHDYYSLTDSASGKTINRRMYDIIRIDTNAYLTSNHKSFSCYDCHSEDFKTFPHPMKLRFEEMWNCLDCHANDEKYSKFHFEEIDKEYNKSVHAKLKNGSFSCWECHNPHSYKINIRNSKNLNQTIAYDNNICLDCHSNFKRFQLLTDHKEVNLIEKHDWLPNQSLHFSQVRCIECHAQTNDSILVSHLIMPKEKAVKRCVECHSSNSILMASLYKFKAKENRSKIGFLNSIILSNSYVIGANRNLYLNQISIALFGIALLALLIHAILRIVSKKSNKPKQ